MYKKILREVLKETENSNLEVVMHNKPDVCRVCMATNDADDVTIVSLFEHLNRNLADDIEFCTGVLISEEDNLPKKICQSCLQKLKIAYIFKSKCLLTDKKLKSLSFKVEIEIMKQEPADDCHAGDDSHANDEVVNSGDDVVMKMGDECHTGVDIVNTGDESHADDEVGNMGDKSHVDDDVVNTDDESNVDDDVWNTDDEVVNMGDGSHADDDVVNADGDENFFGDSAPMEPTTSLEAPDPFHCNLCEANFTTILAKRRHHAKIHKKETRDQHSAISYSAPVDTTTSLEAPDPFHCNLCGANFTTILAKRRHNAKIHKKETQDKHSAISYTAPMEPTTSLEAPDPFHCNLCGANFATILGMRRHLAEIHHKTHTRKRTRKTNDSATIKPTTAEAILNRFHCRLCGIYFPTIQEKQRHRRKNHMKKTPKTEDKCICELCGKQLGSSLTMRGHMLSHQPPSMFCAHCDYKTNNRSDLSKHLMLHTGEKPYKCKYCSLQFTVSSNMWNHVRRKHENVGVKFSCTVCHCKYSSKDGLKKHMEVHFNRRNFECDVCGAQLKNRKNWKKHLKNLHSVIVPEMKKGRKKELLMEE